jgi:hypothetical protein
VALLALMFFGQVAGAMLCGMFAGVYAALAHVPVPQVLAAPEFLASAILLGSLVGIGATVAYTRHLAADAIADGSALGVGWVAAPDRALVTGLAWGAALGVAVLLAIKLLPPDLEALKGPLSQLFRAGGFPMFCGLAIVLLIAPVYEEFLYRGAVFAAFRRRWSLWPSALASGSVFVVMHAADKLDYLPGFAFVAVLAALTTFLRVRYKSLAPGIVAHLAYNYLLTLLG